MDEIDGPAEPATPLAEQPNSIPVSPTSPTHPNFYQPPSDSPPDGIRRTLSGTYTNEPLIKSPPKAFLEPINLVLRLR